MSTTLRSRSAPPSYLLHKSTGQARVRICGKDHYLGPFGSQGSRERYVRLLAEHAAGPVPEAAPTATAVAPLSVTELIARYWAWCEAYYVKHGRPSDHLHVIRQALRTLRELYGSALAASFGPLALRAAQKHLAASGKSRVYVNNLCAEIRRAFKWGVSHELLPPSVHQALSTVPGLKRGRCQARDTEPIKPVDDETIDATNPYLPPVVADMVRFHRLVGCRPTEVCILRPGDVDTSGDVWVYAPSEHKTEHHGRERRIFIGPLGQGILRPYLLRPEVAYCFSPQDSERNRRAELRVRRKTRVQPSQLCRRKAKPRRAAQERYTKDSYNRAVRRAVDKANADRVDALKKELGRDPSLEEAAAVKLPRWRPNQLRHAAATSIRRAYGIEAAQTVLGHSRCDVSQVYAERDWRLAADVARKLG